MVMAKPKHNTSSQRAQPRSMPSYQCSVIYVQLSMQMAGVTLTVGTARQLAAQYQLQGAKALPPGLARQQLPASYVQQLPARDGCQWSQVSSELLLVATGVVVELLSDVFWVKA